MLTLTEIIAREGSQEKAAHFLGVTLSTLRRWLAGHKASPMAQVLMQTKGVEVPR